MDFVDSVIFKMPFNPAQVNTTKYLGHTGEKKKKFIDLENKVVIILEKSQIFSCIS